MAYDTFSWDPDTGAGNPSAFEGRRNSPIVGPDLDAGYAETAPEYTRDLWTFTVSWSILRPASYIYLVDFFHDHRGGLPFYFRQPWGLYGIPPEYETADPGGLSPWSSEVDPGYGDAPTHLVRFNSGVLPIAKARQVSCWSTTSPVEFRQI
jgi:hypothetical protein